MIKFETIHGDSGPYMTRLILGRLRVHKFHRGDDDPDPHTHPWPFWTFPLTGYWELVETSKGSNFYQFVKPFRLHYRPADHCHRVQTRFDREGDVRPIWTIVWTGKKAKSWGFMVDGRLVPWREYLRQKGRKPLA